MNNLNFNQCSVMYNCIIKWKIRFSTLGDSPCKGSANNKSTGVMCIIIYLYIIGCCYNILLYTSTALFDDIMLYNILLLNQVKQYRCVIYFTVVPVIRYIGTVGHSPFFYTKKVTLFRKRSISKSFQLIENKITKKSCRLQNYIDKYTNK